MKGDGGFIRGRYGWLLFALMVASTLTLYKYRGGDSDTPVEAGNSELQIRGRQFKAEVESKFIAMSKADARRTYVLIDVCKKYFPKGIPFSDVDVMLISAGARSGKEGGAILVPDYNHSLPPDSPDRNDLGGGFLLDRSLVSNSVFEIIFRPENVNLKPEVVGEVVDCFVRTTNL